MSEGVGLIGLETIKENEDGSADYVFHLDEHARTLLAEQGLNLVLHCAIAGLDMQVVYDFLESCVRNEEDEPTKHGSEVKEETGGT